MTYAAPPARTEISDTYPNPSNAVARVGFGKLWDYVTGLLGSTGSPTAAKAALLVPQDVDFTNRIINGAMMIDQRNAGASVTANDDVYPVDRFKFSTNLTSKGTGQQSSTAPAGFTKSILFTSSSAYSVGSSDKLVLQQRIEGFNVADLAWGTASAQTITISFWVRSSLTGTFGGSVYNASGDRCYVFSYTINAANTWEQKSVTIAGDTSGTWATNSSVGLFLNLSMGAGTAQSAAAGSWGGTAYVSVTGATSVVGTNAATFYITGVQLEKGTAATGFASRPYGTELALCQRYFQTYQRGVTGVATTPNTLNFCLTFVVPMRSSPSVSPSGAITATDTFAVSNTQSSANATIGGSSLPDGATVQCLNFSGFTQGRLVQLDSANPSKLQFSAEL